MSNACYMCDNARINDDLTDDNDYSVCCVGVSSENNRIVVSSGWGKPLSIDFELWNDFSKCWNTVAYYNPKFCPNCGREIFEFKKK